MMLILSSAFVFAIAKNTIYFPDIKLFKHNTTKEKTP